MDILRGLQIESSLGSGSNATVLQVRSLRSGAADSDDNIPKDRALALKVMSHFWDENAKKLLDCERHALATLPYHPSIIRVIREWSSAITEPVRAHLPTEMVSAADRAHSTQFFIMELHPATLDSWRFAWPSPMPYHILWRIARDMLSVLVHMQSVGAAHLDLKLDNILLGYDGRAVLTDFGISRMFGQGSPMSLPYSEPFGLLMNRLVLSPEVLQAYDRAKEVYRRHARRLEKEKEKAGKESRTSSATPGKPIDARLDAVSSSGDAVAPTVPGLPPRTPARPTQPADGGNNTPAVATPSGTVVDPSARELSVPFAAQGVWALGAVLYELATGYGHEPSYPEDGGGMRAGWTNAATWPPMPVACTSDVIQGVEVIGSPSSSAAHTNEAHEVDRLVRLPDGTFRRLVKPTTFQAQQLHTTTSAALGAYPVAFSGLIMSMLSSDPNVRINAEDALRVVEAVAPRYVEVTGHGKDAGTPTGLDSARSVKKTPSAGSASSSFPTTPKTPSRPVTPTAKGGAAAAGASGAQGQGAAGEHGSTAVTTTMGVHKLDDGSAIVSSGSADPVTYMPSHVVTPATGSSRGGRDSARDGGAFHITLKPSRDVAHLPVVPVLVRHWSGCAKLAHVLPTAKLGHVLSAWNATGGKDGRPALPLVIQVADALANGHGTANTSSGLQFPSVAAKDVRLFLGGYEVTPRAVLGNLASRLAPLPLPSVLGRDGSTPSNLPSSPSSAPVDEDDYDESWSDDGQDGAGGHGHGDDDGPDPDDAPYRVTPASKRKLSRYLSNCGGVLIIDIAPSAGESAAISGRMHVDCLEAVCRGWLPDSDTHGPGKTSKAGAGSKAPVKSVCMMPAPPPLLMHGDDTTSPVLMPPDTADGQPCPLLPCIHAPLQDGPLPDPLPVSSLPAAASVSSRRKSGASGSAVKSPLTSSAGSAGSSPAAVSAGPLTDNTAAVQAAVELQSQLSVQQRRQLAMQWVKAYGLQASIDQASRADITDVSSIPQAIGVLVRPTLVDMRAGLMYRCMLALTGLSNTALRETGSSFPFVECCKFATAALTWYPHRHEIVAAAAGLLRNASCIEEIDLAGHMVHGHGALRALMKGYFSSWASTEASDAFDVELVQNSTCRADAHAAWRHNAGAKAANRHHGQDSRLAEDCILAASNLMRFDELQKPQQHVPVYGLARMATDALLQAKTAAGHAQSVHDSGLRLLRYVLCIEGQLSVPDLQEARVQVVAVSSGAVATAVTRAGTMAGIAHSLGIFSHDRAIVENGLHALCSLLVHENNRTSSQCPVQQCSEAVVAALGLPEYQDDTAILGLGATVIRNLACVTVDSPDTGQQSSESDVGPVGGDDALEDTPFNTAPASVSKAAAATQPDFSPALAVTAAGAPTVLEEIMSRHPTVHSIQENARCALYNLLLLGSADARGWADNAASAAASAAAAKAEADQLRTRLAELQKQADEAVKQAEAAKAFAVAAASAGAASAAVPAADRAAPPEAGPALDGPRRGAALLTGAPFNLSSPRDGGTEAATSSQSTEVGDASGTRVATTTTSAATAQASTMGRIATVSETVDDAGSSVYYTATDNSDIYVDVADRSFAAGALAGVGVGAGKGHAGLTAAAAEAARQLAPRSTPRNSIAKLKPATESVLFRVDHETGLLAADGRRPSGKGHRNSHHSQGTARGSVVDQDGDTTLDMSGVLSEGHASVADWTSPDKRKQRPSGSKLAGAVASGAEAQPKPKTCHDWACWNQFTVAFWVVLFLLIVAVGAAVVGWLVF